MPLNLDLLGRETHPGAAPKRPDYRQLDCRHESTRFAWRWYGEERRQKRFGYECTDCGEWGVRRVGERGSQISGEKNCWEIFCRPPGDAVPSNRALAEFARRQHLHRVWEARDKLRREHSAQWWDWYNRYLQSKTWRLTRAYILKRDNNTCQVCGGPGEQVHHLTYARVGDEAAEDLITLCETCHEAEHAK